MGEGPRNPSLCDDGVLEGEIVEGKARVVGLMTAKGFEVVDGSRGQNSEGGGSERDEVEKIALDFWVMSILPLFSGGGFIEGVERLFEFGIDA